MRYRFAAKSIFFALAVCAIALPAQAQFTQQGNKLVPAGITANAALGWTTAISADGNTLVSAGLFENGNVGGAYVFVRSGTTWTQQGGHLLGTGAVGAAYQGAFVALSADGNTIALGGPADNANAGAIWIFTRSGGTWTQQGNKLLGTGNTGNAQFGTRVSLSADGNTLAASGVADNSGIGAVWVFTRSGSAWTQQGSKLVPNDLTGAAQVATVSLSADGNTLAVGANQDNGSKGAAWVYTRSNGLWTQSTAKLVATGSGAAAQVGTSIAMAGDGNTFVIGGPSDNTNQGGVFVFVRNGAAWAQQGNKIVGGGATGNGQHGVSVAISLDGNEIAFGGWNDNTNVGAVWIFRRSGTTWSQYNNKLLGSDRTPYSNGSVLMGTSVALSSSGSTLAFGGPADGAGDAGYGAVWVFTEATMTVAPATNITVNGPVGGPFLPPSLDYTVTVPETTSVTITGVPDWLTTNFAGGTLSGGSVTPMNFTVNANAKAKAAGTYGPSNIVITNATSGLGNRTIVAMLTVNAPGDVTVLSAVLPASRSVKVGNTATAFATIINTSSNGGINCGLSLGSNVPTIFRFQTTNPATNALTGTLNTGANIPGNGSQSYVIALTPTAAFPPNDVQIIAGCSNGVPVTPVVGLNTLLLSASATDVPDIVALAATVSNDGIANIAGNNGTGVFAVASVNVGVAGDITVSADTGSASLPLDVKVCQTNPSTGACLAPAAASVTTNIIANATPTFSFFLTGSGAIAFNPATNRIFARFKDSGGLTRGSTSVAVRTQ